MRLSGDGGRSIRPVLMIVVVAGTPEDQRGDAPPCCGAGTGLLFSLGLHALIAAR